jgi:16S rRNA (cytosine1402-N4)-methyltransferase
MNPQEFQHRTVLLQESVDLLDIHPGDVVVDGTVGSGGHTEEIIKRFGNTVHIIALDADSDALARSQARLEGFGAHITFKQSNFRNIDEALRDLHIETVHKVLLDLGWSTDQFEDKERGFSFQIDAPLRMVYKKYAEGDITAETILNEWGEETIATILFAYGEERYARRIASKIVQARVRKPILTTFELVNIILEATPLAYHHRKIHAATKTFQALRIAVNDELQALKEGIEKIFNSVAPGGRIAIISFHSLEDRIVKRFFQQKVKDGVALRITKKPITPSSEEIKVNRRARSAKLRVITKV